MSHADLASLVAAVARRAPRGPPEAEQRRPCGAALWRRYLKLAADRAAILKAVKQAVMRLYAYEEDPARAGRNRSPDPAAPHEL
jgi:hypothetical protein